MRAFLITIIASASISVAAAQTQPATLTLACKGTMIDKDIEPDKKRPYSMSIMFNFTAGTVEFTNFLTSESAPVVRITAVNDLTIRFDGSRTHSQYETTISGSLDRVTGDMNMALRVLRTPLQIGGRAPETKVVDTDDYELQCRPTQRMF